VGRPDVHVVAHRRQGSGGHDLARRSEEQLAGRQGASAQHDHLGIEHVDHAHQAVPEPTPDLGQHVARRRVAVVGQLGHDCAGDLAPPCGPPPELRVGPGEGGLHPVASYSRARGQHLEAATPRALPLALGSVQVHHHVTDLRGEPERAPVDATVEQQPAADARAQGDQHGVREVARGAEARLGEQSRVCVVVHYHRQAEAFAHHVAKAHVLERQMGGPARHAGLPLHQGGDAEAHGRDIRGRRAHLLDRLDEDVERLRPIGPAPGPAHPVMHHETLVDDAAQQLRPTRVDTYHPPWRHGQ
jgi:hypothetical protein